MSTDRPDTDTTTIIDNPTLIRLSQLATIRAALRLEVALPGARHSRGSMLKAANVALGTPGKPAAYRTKAKAIVALTKAIEAGRRILEAQQQIINLIQEHDASGCPGCGLQAGHKAPECPGAGGGRLACEDCGMEVGHAALECGGCGGTRLIPLNLVEV